VLSVDTDIFGRPWITRLVDKRSRVMLTIRGCSVVASPPFNLSMETDPICEMVVFYVYIEKSGNPYTEWTGSEGCRRLRLPYFKTFVT